MRRGSEQSIQRLVRYYHRGQRDKAGNDYYEAHLEPVADMVPRHLYAVALGHDLFEDTLATREVMFEAGFDIEDVFLIKTLTKEDGCDTMEYLNNIKAYPNAVIVKLADITSNLSRLENIKDPFTRDRLRRKYYRYLRILTNTW